VVWLVGLLAGAALFHVLGAARPRRVAAGGWLAVRAVAGLVVAALVVWALQSADSGVGAPAGLSWLIVLLIVVGLGMWLLLELTTFGRGLKATGSNAEAARLAGIRTKRH